MSNPPHLLWRRLPALSLAHDESLSAAWDRLNAKRCDLPFLTAAAVKAALQVFGTGRETLMVATRQDQVVAMLVLSPQRLGWQTFQPSQLPLGAWVAEPGLSLGEMARGLFRGPLRFSLVFSMTQLDPRLTAREADTEASASADYIETGWIDVAGTFEDYWSERGKNLRLNMRKQRSKLAADGIALRTRVLTDPQDMAAAIGRYGQLESAGWKASRGTAIRLDNEQGRFYRNLLETAARDGGAVVYECLFDDRTMAMNLCLRRGDTLVVLKTTYDESIQSLSPAFLLNQDVVESIFKEQRIRRVEYYGRLMDWHTKWTANKRVLFHFTAYRWPFVKTVAVRRAAQARLQEPSAPAHTSA